MSRAKKSSLPEMFRPLLWSYRFAEMDPARDKHVIIVNTINYGDLQHWRWLVKQYGRQDLRRYISETPASEFRPEVLKLVRLLFGIKVMRYASYYDYYRAKRAFAWI